MLACQATGQVINTIAGTGTPAYSGDGSPAVTAAVNTPYGVAVDGHNNVYIADYGNNRIRKIDSFGMMSTIAGTGVAGFSGDGAAATAAKIYGPRGIAADPAGNVYFSDYANNRIRKINTAGIITTIAGTGTAGFAGDGGPATAANLNFAWGVALDGAGNIYLADQLNCRIRKIDAAGTISTIGGTGIAFFYGDGGPALSAGIQYPLGVAVDAAGNVYVADNGNNRIRVINTAGNISTIAGSATYGFSGDGGPSTASKLYYPRGIAADPAGNVYICDVNNNRIRKINTSGIINTITGDGTAAYSGDGGLAVLARINQSTGVAVDAAGRVYIADNENSRIRVIEVVSHKPYFTRGDSQTVSFCASELIGIDSLLPVFDIDTGQTETWSVAQAPLHGTVVAGYTTLSTGSILPSSGSFYTPTIGYLGADSFKIRVTDGTYSDTTTIYANIIPMPNAGIIIGPDSVCLGASATLASSVPGGTWTSSNTAIATVSGGVVTGVASGSSVITYSVTNACGTATATFPVLVSFYCNVGVNTVHTPVHNSLDIFPNPGKGTFTIFFDTSTNEPVHVVISNVMGKKVKEFTARISNSYTVKFLLDAPPGVYFISATSPAATWSGKLTVEK